MTITLGNLNDNDRYHSLLCAEESQDKSPEQMSQVAKGCGLHQTARAYQDMANSDELVKAIAWRDEALRNYQISESPQAQEYWSELLSVLNGYVTRLEQEKQQRQLAGLIQSAKHLGEKWKHIVSVQDIDFAWQIGYGEVM